MRPYEQEFAALGQAAARTALELSLQNARACTIVDTLAHWMQATGVTPLEVLGALPLAAAKVAEEKALAAARETRPIRLDPEEPT